MRFFLCACVSVLSLFAADLGKEISFDIPGGPALKALKEFSAQSGQHLLYANADLDGVSTNEVKGRLTVGDALNRLLAGTPLTASRASNNGAVAVGRAPRETSDPNGERAARDSDRPRIQSKAEPTNSTMKKNRFPARLGAVLTAFATTILGAQTEQNPRADSASNPNQDPAVQLSPFTVATEKDTGYIASDSLVGGRISTNLLMTPADVSVLTKEFLSDIAADTYQDAAKWLTGATVTPQNQQDFGTDTSFRGLGGVSIGYPSRNYFRYNNGVDGYIVERLEASRGPNALLFGDGVVAGVLNTLTKRARPARSFTEIQVRLDSEGTRRVTMDINRPIGKTAAVRVNLVESDVRSWIETYYNKRHGAQITGLWRPWQGGELRLEMEWMRGRTNFAPFSLVDQSSNWDRTTVVSAPLTFNPAASTGISRFTADRLIWGPTYYNIGVQNYRNFGASTGANLAILQTDRGIPNSPHAARNFSIQPENVFHSSNYRVLGAYFSQDIGRSFSFELAAQRVFSPHTNIANKWQSHTIDVNTILPNGAPNPNFGKAYSDGIITVVPNQDNTHDDLRLAAVYILPFEKFSQRFNLIASRRGELFEFKAYRYARANGSVLDMRDGSNAITIRRYLDERDPSLSHPSSGNGLEIGTVPVNDVDEKQTLNTLQIASVGSYWSDRLSLVGGLRFDDYDRTSRNFLASILPNGQPNRAAFAPSGNKAEVRTESSGAVFFPIKQVGVYLNHSGSFNPANTGSALLDGTLVQPTKGRGRTAGFRFRLGDGRVVGSLGYYDTFEHRRNGGYVTTEINRLWENIGQFGRQIGTATYRDTLTAGGNGYELDLVANLSKNLRVRLNGNLPDNEQRETIPQLRAYYAANIALWQAGADDPNNTFRSQIQSDINALKTRMENANEGRKINGLAQYTANLYASYTMAKGPLKSLRLGGGVNAYGKTIIGNQPGRPFDYFYAQAYHIASAMLGYPVKVRGASWDCQLNISNALDYEDPIFLGTALYNGSIVRNSFYYIEPRKYTLTVTARY